MHIASRGRNTTDFVYTGRNARDPYYKSREFLPVANGKWRKNIASRGRNTTDLFTQEGTPGIRITNLGSSFLWQMANGARISLAGGVIPLTCLHRKERPGSVLPIPGVPSCGK